ncbi:MAG: hypothetical protein CMO74_14375 [Verrucomicrobiales bacterium]|nr:hypothetical protein [Verrucomicrobiales bacterium]|tara:strand:- start:80284 stop:80622 length:339 start_codon:yes stop_codon:yes gene_type:complete
MPLYTFEHPETGEHQDVLFGMNDDKSYVDSEGTSWIRVWHSPQATVDANIDPFSSSQYLEKTNTRGTMGDLQERSRELSEKRASKLGYDPIKKKYFEEYSKKRNGIKHHLDT